MDSEMKEYFDRRFEEAREHVDTRFEESQTQLAEFRRDVEHRFEQVEGKVHQVEDKVRQTHVVVEDVRGLVQTVAEGLVAVSETQQQNTETLRGEIGEVRDLLTASYRYLDRRLAAPEGHA